MALLSTGLAAIRHHYDVIVIGSGYGGAIAACRLARATKPDGTSVRVCLLERGREIPVGRFPRSLNEARKEMQIDIAGVSIPDVVVNKNGLYWFRASKDVSVFQGCGLGGTSLINANVSLTPEPWVWEDSRWPTAIRSDAAGIKRGFDRARDMLSPTPYPESEPRLAKYQALERSAKQLGLPIDRPPINVTLRDGLNSAGVHQDKCTGCGDCVTGCNVGAKNTLMMNYLPDAKSHGAEIFCSVGVRRLARREDRWHIYYRPIGAHREVFDGPDLFVEADVVIVAAGTLGTTELLLRSREQNLGCSDRVGHHLTNNGDFLGFGYNNDQEINGMGRGDHVSATHPPGPCITGKINGSDQPEREDGFIIEEGVIPSPIVKLMPAALGAAAALTGKDTDRGAWDKVKEWWRELKTFVLGPYRGALRNTETYLVIAHDDANGVLELEDDRVKIVWPDVGKQPRFHKLSDKLEEATKATGGTYVPFPLFNTAFGHNLVTVHPLGGCVMADSADGGVINHKGQVFSGREGDRVYESLYVNDGAMIPRSLAVNPLFTICALAERNIALLASDRHWSIDDSRAKGPALYDGRVDNDDSPKPIVQFTERMAGYCSTAVLDDYTGAAKAGKAADTECSFVLTIQCDDLDQFIADKQHESGLYGTVFAPILSDEPLAVTDGSFNLFVDDTENRASKRMRYRMKLCSVEGQSYYFDGFKVIRDDEGFDVVADTTTLYVTIYDGQSDTDEVKAKGVLHISIGDFAKQLTTMEARDRAGASSIKNLLRFGRLFAGNLWETHGPKL